MRYLVSLLPVLTFSAVIATAQTGFSTKTYPAVLPATTDYSQLLSVDLNGDGRPDLFAYGPRYSASTVPGDVFLNDGSGGFGAPVALPGSALLSSAMIGDMNGDGFPDIVGCTNVGTGQTQAVNVIVYLNNGNGTFKALPAVSGNGECNSLTLGDVYHNGHLDIVTAGYTNGQYGPGGTFYPGNTNYVDVFNNDGTGTVMLKATGSATLDDTSNVDFTNCGAIDVVGGDFLNNGNFDLILTTQCQPQGQNLPGYTGTVFYVAERQDSYGNWNYDSYNHLQTAYEIYTHGQAAMNLNGNGRLDVLFLGNQNNTEGDLIEGVNDGAQSFTFNKLFTSGYFFGSAVADFNGDGRDDVSTTYDGYASGTPYGPPMLTILAGTTTGTFTDSQDFATGPSTSYSGGLIAADLNGDGRPDMATLVYDSNSRSTSLNVYLNTQNGSSTPCSPPTTPNTNIICSPANNATLNSPVTVNAASNVTGFTINRLYLDNVSVYQTTSQQVSTPINAAAGNHHLVLVSYNSSGQAFTSSTNFTVGNPTGNGCIPSTAGVSICSPATGSTDTSPVTVTAGAMAQSGSLTAMRVYIDNVAVYTTSVPSGSKTFQFSEQLGASSGTHHLVVVGYETTGGAVTSSVNFTVASGPCTAPTSGSSLRICSPTATATNASPITVSAGANTSTGYIASMRIYIDNSAVVLIPNGQHTASFTISQQESVTAGTHSLVVVAYPSTGGSISGRETITVQ